LQTIEHSLVISCRDAGKRIFKINKFDLAVNEAFAAKTGNSAGCVENENLSPLKMYFSPPTLKPGYGLG